ncbi:hypothetical protein NDU88_007290 [Pleurodeles waltl]|uniref:Uncharacterized protein n=1 Tax=Pleurodeles waltl TaxID=8319 RepID=A0AAV7N9S6_PLEWA|nr:hypothetical protein NDU88_007290 [Pleurodeles waltl]
MGNKPGWYDNSDEMDEYVFDMSNDDEMDEFTMLDSSEKEQRKEVKDSLGHALFEPSDVKHPHSAEWWPMRHMAECIKQKIKKPLERNDKNIMRAECSHPVIGDKDSMTPNLDPDLITYLFKLCRDPRNGFERSLKQCEDRLLDALEPLARIFDVVEEYYVKGTDLDINLLKGWSQRAIFYLGNANAGLIAERRMAILLRLSPKLGELAGKETSEETKGLLFGEGMIKALGKYVQTFTALNKAHSSMRKVFGDGNLYGRAGRSGQSFGRTFYRGLSGYGGGSY